MTYSLKQTSTNYVNRRFLNEDCKVNAALETFSGRWTMQVLFCIHFGLNRFGLLKQKLVPISDQILALRLNHLIKHKLVSKKDDNGERTYTLTAKGQALIPILEALEAWQSKR